jgi:hypothetical protein
MIKLTQSSPNPSGIRFPDDTTRAVSFRAFAKPTDATASVTYSIESEGAAFGGQPNPFTVNGVQISAAGSAVNQSLAFRATADGIFQVIVKAHVEESGDNGSFFDVFWVVPVFQSPAKAAATAGLVAAAFKAVDADEAFMDAADVAAVDASVATAGAAPAEVAAFPLDRSELRQARRFLLTLKAAVEAALSASSHTPATPADGES